MSVYRDAQDAVMDEDSVVAPLALSSRLEKLTPEPPRKQEVEEEADEAAHFRPARRKTKVQEMVASLESKSRGGSPRRQS